MPKIIATTPTGKVIDQFVPTKYFENTHKSGGISGYMKGAKYHVREGNSELIANVKKWRKAGKVV